ncbi:hypothetical protein DV736_g1175, partial [Chaetothyriales sp. CBS 134916]
MPAEVTEIKNLLEIARRKDAKSARMKRVPVTHKGQTSQQIKFKIRCKRYLYTLILNDSSKADKIKQSLPPGLHVTEVGKKNKKTKKN